LIFFFFFPHIAASRFIESGKLRKEGKGSRPRPNYLLSPFSPFFTWHLAFLLRPPSHFLELLKERKEKKPTPTSLFSSPLSSSLLSLFSLDFSSFYFLLSLAPLGSNIRLCEIGESSVVPAFPSSPFLPSVFFLYESLPFPPSFPKPDINERKRTQPRLFLSFPLLQRFPSFGSFSFFRRGARRKKTKKSRKNPFPPFPFLFSGPPLHRVPSPPARLLKERESCRDRFPFPPSSFS